MIALMVPRKDTEAHSYKRLKTNLARNSKTGGVYLNVARGLSIVGIVI